jgi:hypothetical protein
MLGKLHVIFNGGGVAENESSRQCLEYGKENGPDKLMFTRERAAAPEGNVRERICANVEERVILVGLNAYVFSICYGKNRIFF